MNLPTPIEKVAFEKLPESLKPYTEARLNKPVKLISDNELKYKCLDLISKSYSEQAQFNIESEILNHQTKTLYEELRSHSKFRELTWQEVQNAFRFGIRGESGPFFGMCAKTYHQFLKHYNEKPERVNGMKQYLELMNKETTPQLSPEEKLKKSKEACLWYFNEYKQSGKLPNGHYAIYETLFSLGLCRLPVEQKKAIRIKVTQEYEKGLQSAFKRGAISKNQLKDVLESLDTNPTLKGLLRKEALKQYFDGMISNGENLEL